MTANGNIQDFTEGIRLDGDIPGELTSIMFWVEDDKGGVSNEVKINNIGFVHPPELVEIEMLEDNFINDEEILIFGKIRDKNIGKEQQLYYTIEEIPEHTNKKMKMVNPQILISNGGVNEFQAKIILDNNIPTGEYNLKVWVEDDKGGVSNVHKTDISIKSILYLIQEKLVKYIPRDKIEDMREIVINTDNVITPNEENDNLITNISNTIEDLQSGIFFIGKDGDTEKYVKSNLTDKYKVNIENYILPYEADMAYMFDYILEKHNVTEENKKHIFNWGLHKQCYEIYRC